MESRNNERDRKDPSLSMSRRMLLDTFFLISSCVSVEALGSSLRISKWLAETVEGLLTVKEAAVQIFAQ